MEVQKLVAEVQKLAESELQYCNQHDTPYVCAMTNTDAGKKQIIQLIVEYVGKHGMSISEAIVQIENERNSNLNEIG
jgi:hypothetical protein